MCTLKYPLNVHAMEIVYRNGYSGGEKGKKCFCRFEDFVPTHLSSKPIYDNYT